MVGIGSTTIEIIVRQIRKIFQGYAIVDGENINQLRVEKLNYDVIIDTTKTLKMTPIPKKIKDLTIVAQRIVDYKYIKELILLPNGTQVMLVNDTKNNAYDTITHLKNIGIGHLVFHPVYPGVGKYPKLEIAITPGEPQLVPKDVKKIIDIKPRILDIRTISKLVDMLGIGKQIVGNLNDEYIRDIVNITKSIENARRKISESEIILSKVFDAVITGLIYVDDSGRILKYNKSSLSILNKKEITNENILDYLDIKKIEKQEKIIKINNKNIFLKIQHVDIAEIREFIIILDYIENIIETDQKIRKNMVSGIVSDLYTFDDFITINNTMINIIKNAKKFSKTDATMLIEGENGTGKEIIAQGIHMRSNRKNKNFVPFNMAAISTSLLESELFGYEEGAFTGAKKGGKIGLFELANGGTLFMDEIGDMPFDLQVKLLRVLQEKKIRRVGGIEEIPIDVRIVAATNKELIKLVNDGSFRADLYYRLNVLPVKILPLRKRKDDIYRLLDYYIKRINSKIEIIDIFDQCALEFIREYKWPGNVRELINLTQFIMLIYSGDKIGIEEFPYYMVETNIDNESSRCLSNEEYWVLEQIEQNKGIGRGKLTKLAKNLGMGLGEGIIRRMLSELNEKGYINSMGNNRGYEITIHGSDLLT